MTADEEFGVGTADLDAILTRAREQATTDDAEYRRVHDHCLRREAALYCRLDAARAELASALAELELLRTRTTKQEATP